MFWQPALANAPSSSQNISIHLVCLFVFMSKYNWHEPWTDLPQLVARELVFSARSSNALSSVIWFLQCKPSFPGKLGSHIHKGLPTNDETLKWLEILKIWHFKVDVCLLPWILSLNDLFNDFSREKRVYGFRGSNCKETESFVGSPICFVVLFIYFCV